MTDLHADELAESLRPAKAVLVCLGIALVALCLAYGGGYWHGATVTARRATVAEAKAIQKADQAKGEADALKVQASAKDAEIAAKDRGLDESRAAVAKANQELREYRALHASVSASAPSGASIDGQPVQPGVDDLAGLAAKQDAVIQAQANFIKGQDVKISDLTISRDLHKLRADAAECEALNLRAALAAKEGLLKAAELRGFRNGFLCGALAGGGTGGYAGYRIGRNQ